MRFGLYCRLSFRSVVNLLPFHFVLLLSILFILLSFIYFVIFLETGATSIAIALTVYIVFRFTLLYVVVFVWRTRTQEDFNKQMLPCSNLYRLNYCASPFHLFITLLKAYCRSCSTSSNYSRPPMSGLFC